MISIIVMWNVMEDRDSEDVAVDEETEKDELKNVNVASKIKLFQQRIRRYSEIKEEASTEREYYSKLLYSATNTKISSIMLFVSCTNSKCC